MKLYLMPILTALSLAASLQPGDPLPVMKGEFLTGRDAVLPAAATGKIALLALGFSYDSRMPVEEWVKRFRKDFGTNSGIAFYEIPMIGGLGAMGKWFINRGMRNGTPKADHEHVITVYGGAVNDWKSRSGLKSDKEACVLLLDRGGVVRWHHDGMFGEAAYTALAASANALMVKTP